MSHYGAAMPKNPTTHSFTGKKLKTDAHHMVEVKRGQTSIRISYETLSKFEDLKQKYHRYGHNSDTLWLPCDMAEFIQCLDVLKNPLADCPIKPLITLKIEPVHIESPATFLKFCLEKSKVVESKYIKVACFTRTDRFDFKFHPDFCDITLVDGEQHHTLTVGDYTFTKPLEKIRDGTENKYMVFRGEEAKNFLRSLPDIEIEPRLSMLIPEAYQYYLILMERHRKTFIKALCQQFELEAKTKKYMR